MGFTVTYFFNYRFFGRNHSLFTYKTASHALEIPYLFNVYPVLKDGDKILSEYLIDRFTSFASGDINVISRPLSTINSQGILESYNGSYFHTLEWPKYDEKRSFMIFDYPSPSIGLNLQGRKCDLWDTLYHNGKPYNF